MLDRLNERMVQFIGRQETVWIATADANRTARILEAGGNGHGPRPRAERWVEVRVREAYIHCRRHLPHLVRVNGEGRDWGTDDARAKGGDYFGAVCQARPAAPG